MRILHVVSCRGWSSDAYWTARAACELERRGHQVTVVGREDAEDRVLRPLAAAGVRRIETLALAGGVRPLADLPDARWLAKLMGDADVVHLHRGKEHWLAAMSNRLRGTPRPLVRTRHIAQAVRPHAGNRWLYRRATALVVTVSEAIRRQYLAADLVEPGRVVTVRGGADTERFGSTAANPEQRRALGVTDGALLIGMVGGLRVMKGHEVVLEALARAGADLAGARLVFVGRGRAEAAIRDAVRRRDLDGRVSFAGFVADPPAVMAALDVGLYVPLESDGMSRVLFEYLAAGVALVVSRTGVVPEVVRDGVEALVVPAGDPAALARALVRLAGDRDLRARLGASGRQAVVERYSGACLGAALEAHYLAVLGA